jgi:hypothetical protein
MGSPSRVGTLDEGTEEAWPVRKWSCTYALMRSSARRSSRPREADPSGKFGSG